MSQQQLKPDDPSAGPLRGLALALRDLGFAVKSLQLYPSSSPIVHNAIERSYRSLAPLLGDGYPRLDISPNGFTVDDHKVGEDMPVIEQLARRMHGVGFARLYFDRRLQAASLKEVAEVVAMNNKTLQERGGIQEVYVQAPDKGVLAEFLDLERLFDVGDDDEELDIWEAMLRGYKEAEGAADDLDWAALSSSVESLAGFLSWLASNLDALAEQSGYEPVDIVRFAVERLGSAAPDLTAERVDSMVHAIRDVFEEFDTDTMIELLADPLEIELPAEEGDGDLRVSDPHDPQAGAPTPRPETIDVRAQLAGDLHVEQVVELVLHALKTREPSTPRIYGLFRRLTIDQGKRGEVVRHVHEEVESEADRGQADFLSNWPRLFDVLNGEAPQRFLTAEYEAGLQKLLAPGGLEDAWPAERVAPRLSEMAPTFIGSRRVRLLARLLGESEDPDHDRLARELGTSVQEVLEAEDFMTLASVFQELGQLVRRTDDDARCAAATRVMDAFFDAKNVRELVYGTIGRDKAEVSRVAAMIRARGAPVVPILLDLLANAKTRRARQRILGLLARMGDAVGEVLVDRFDDDRWFVLRNLAMIVGEVGDPAMVEHLGPMFEHEDARVRREALAATVRLGGDSALAPLRRGLEEPDVAVRCVAVHGLGYHGDADAAAQLRKILKSWNLLGRKTPVVQAAAIALGRLGDEHSRADLQRLARRPWLFRERREPARAAAAWALEALDGEPRRRTPEPPALADIRPGKRSRRAPVRG